MELLDLVWLIPALPLAGFLLLVLGGRLLGEPGAGWLATLMMAGSFGATVAVFVGLLNEGVLLQTGLAGALGTMTREVEIDTLVDALRRAEAFDDAANTAGQLAATHPPDAVAGVIALEQRLIALEDSGRHTVASALPPPSRRPHASHGSIARRNTGPGLWERLRRLWRRS